MPGFYVARRNAIASKVVAIWWLPHGRLPVAATPQSAGPVGCWGGACSLLLACLTAASAKLIIFLLGNRLGQVLHFWPCDRCRRLLLFFLLAHFGWQQSGSGARVTNQLHLPPHAPRQKKNWSQHYLAGLCLSYILFFIIYFFFL